MHRRGALGLRGRPTRAREPPGAGAPTSYTRDTVHTNVAPYDHEYDITNTVHVVPQSLRSVRVSHGIGSDFGLSSIDLSSRVPSRRLKVTARTCTWRRTLRR